MTETITRARVVSTALTILDGGGLPALAMRRIAGELGVQQSALYWHFKNKQQLLAGVADRILDEVAPPTATTWQRRVTQLALNLRAELLRYRDGAELVATVFAFRLGAAAPLTQLEREFNAGDISPLQAATAATVLMHFIFGYTTGEQQYQQAIAAGAIAETEPAPQFSQAGFLRGVELIINGV